MERKRTSWKGRAGKRILGLLALLVVLAGAGWMVLFQVNRFSLEVELQGEPTLNQEYDTPYQDPGARLLLRGSLLWKEGIHPAGGEIQVIGSVNEQELGRYTLCYHGSFGPWQAKQLRQVNVVDTQCPQITLIQKDPQQTMKPGTPYEEEGYKAVDNRDGDITDRVIRVEEPGRILYSVLDSSGNPGMAERVLPYFDPEPPQIRLEGGEHYVLPSGQYYVEPGYQAIDQVDGDVTERVTVEGEVNWLVPGIYPVTYTVTDSYQNTASVTREVEVTVQPRPEVVWPEGKTVYLTFDDGPGPHTLQLLDVLDRYGAKATFFVTDSGYDEVMEQIVQRGHSIGIHTISHQYGQIYSSPEAYFDDLLGMQDIIYRNTGVKTTLLRFPGGSSNEISRRSCEGIMTILDEAVQNAGFQYFDWNVDSNDAGGAKKPQEVFQNVVDGISRARVSMVLQHDVHGFSVEAVEDILVWGQKNGYTFRAIDSSTPGFHHGVHN